VLVGVSATHHYCGRQPEFLPFLYVANPSLPWRVPARPQVYLPRAVQFPGEAEGLRGAGGWHTLGIVLHASHHRTRIVQRLPHAAQHIADVPRPTQRTQARVAVHIVGRPVMSPLARRCRWPGQGRARRIGGKQH